MRKIQTGFTLIELVVVITILGILAAFAIPRFASLDSSARSSAISGLQGSMRSASSLAHAMYLAGGSTASSVTMEGSPVALTLGYPSGTTTGIVASLQDTSGFTCTAAAGAVTCSMSGGSGTCNVVYTNATSNGATPPVITAPTVVSTTTGC